MKTTFLSIFLVFVLMVNAQFPKPYCEENFPNGVLPITRVSFGSINNISPVNPSGSAHEDFSSVTTNIIAGNTYTITVQGNTGGNLTDYYRVFFDWNDDGSFSYNENYYIGSITNSTGSDAAFASTNITVPYDAAGGPTRMRVSKLSSGTVFICNNNGRGQAEDYAVVVSFPPPKTVYVKAGATGANNGSSWTNAYTSLNIALDSIHERDTIKVATGIYKPYTSANSFSLKDAAVLIGGYPSSGNPTDADRNAGMFPTILSGELETSTPFDNALHVLYLQQVSNKTIVDGFIVENGYTRYNTIEPVGLGGGVYLVNANPVIRNCVFRNNLAELEGAAVAATGSNPQFSRCFFVSNGDRTDNSSIYITNSNTTFTNCVFAKNTGTTIFSDQSTLTIKSSTFEGNFFSTHVTGRGYCIFGQNNSSANVYNSIFFDNKSTIGSDSLEIKLTGSIPLVQKTITQVYNGTNPSFSGVDPKFKDTSKIAGADNLFFTADDGLQLMNPCSPAINNGGNNLVSNVGTDILGNPRISDNNTDLGAYEVQGSLLPVPKTIYVNKLAGGANDGSSWVNAYTEISRAIAACSDTIKVAAGTYYPSDSNAFANLLLQNHRILLGGYPSSGNPTDAQRDPTIYPTIISGNLPQSSVHSMVLFRGRYLDSTCQVDGFILQEAVHDFYLAGSDNYYGAAIQLSQSSSPQFSNCIFKNNLGGLTGRTLIAKDQSNPRFYKCKFESDSAGQVTGINIISNFSSSPKFIKCQFQNNRAVFFNNNSSPLIDSCVFSNNKGRSISNDNNSNPVISNSSFLNNEGPDYGNDLYNRASRPVVSNCIFSSSFHTRNGGIVANVEKSSPVFNNCVFRNGYAEFYGGAVYNDNASPTFRKCAFANNYAFSGGAMYSVNHSQANMIQCVIVLNTAGKGSALFNSKSVVSLLHCTISNNGKTVIYNTDSNRLDIRNTLFAENALAVSEAEVTDFDTPVSVTNIYNSLTWAYGTNGVSGNIVRKNGRQWDNIDPDGPDDIFFTADDGVALSPCSPAVNAGENSFAVSISSDVLNNQRLYGSQVDIGAYELQQTPRALQNFFVNPKATGNNSGVDWQNAYNNIQSAFCNACADTVKVAEGVYKPALNDRDSSFFINLPLTILGGYPAFGNPGNDLRDPYSHPTILSGDIGVANDSLDNSKTILIAHAVIDTILLDGLVIRDGNGGSGGISLNAKGGGGLYTYWNHTILRNCQFIKNQASPYGGAISIGYMGDVDISGCKFDENSSTNYGGALYFNGSKLNLRNSVFQNNYSYGYGGALKTESGNWEIVNSVFYRNFTTAQNANCYGGAVHAEKGIGTISNCNFVENRVEYAYGAGGGLFTNQSLAVQVKNCLFKGNSRGGSTTLAGADFDWTNYNTVNHCLLQISRPYATDNKYSEDPLFVDLNNPAGPDGRWMTTDDGLRLQYNSPAIDYGLNSWITESLDITKAPRIVGSEVDAGAYEYQNIPEARAGADTVICPGSSATIGMGGNPAHLYSWTSSPTGFSSNLAKPLVNPSVNTSYYLAVSNGTTVSYDTVKVSVSSTLNPSVSISTRSSAVCQGTNVTFNATPLYEGSTPIYQWIINGSTVNSSGLAFTTASLKNGDLVSLQMTSSAGCATTPIVLSNIITMKVDTLVNPSVTISQSPATICNGSTATLTAMPMNGGNNPTYQWQVNGQNAGSNSNIFTFKPVFASQQLRVIMTSSACAANPTVTSNTLTVLVTQPVTPSVSIIVPTTTICPETSITFVANQTNGGTRPVYQWQKNGVIVGSDTTVYTTSSIADGDVITVVMTSNAPCTTVTRVTSTPITMKVKTIYPTVTVNANLTTICANVPVLFTATGMTGGSSLKYQWKKNGVNVGTNSSTYSTTALTNGDIISVEFTSVGNCPDTLVVTSAPIIITVIPVVRPTISITGATTITQGTTVTLSSNVTNRAPSFAYQWRDSTATHSWQDIPNAVNADLTYTPLASGDKVICTFKNFSSSCLTDTTVTSNVLVFTVTPTAVVSVPANGYGIRYYPNPVQAELVIENLRISDKWETFDVISIDGKQKILTLNCRNQSRLSANLRILKQGTYLGILHSKTGLSVYMTFLKMQ